MPHTALVQNLKGSAMRLAILTVYLFDENAVTLFDYHLARIRRHTSVPFRIFAAAHKLSPELKAYVEAQPEIEVVDCAVPPDFRGRRENAHCLDALAAHAMSGDFSHAICLHLDSFPISDDWIERFVVADATNSDDPMVSAITPNGYSAGLMWSRAFYDSFAPKMLVQDTDRASDPFETFTAAYPDLDHVETGVGYIYSAWRNGVAWNAIGTDEDRKIYSDVLFHLVAGTWRTNTRYLPIRPEAWAQIGWRLVRVFRRLMNERTLELARRPFVNMDHQWRDGSPRTKIQELQDLLEDPDGFVSRASESYRLHVEAT